MSRAAKTDPVPPQGASQKARRGRARILLADDHPVTRLGAAQLLSTRRGLQVVGEAGNAAEVLAALSSLKIDLLITDLAMPGRNGVDLIKDIHAAHPLLPILVVSMHDELLHADRVLKAGARGYLMKEAGGHALLEAVDRVLEGGVYVSEKVGAAILDSVSGYKLGPTSPVEKLTDREFQIFQMIGFGKSSRDIAYELHLSPKTVDVHRGNIKAKLDLKDATALVRHAVRWVETGHPSSGAELK